MLEQEDFNRVWEPACGEGHLSEVLKKHGILELSTDKIDRGYGQKFDFFNFVGYWNGDIITNPPYSIGKDFVTKALETVPDGHKVAMFLKLTFLESKSRKELFLKYPPKIIYVSSSRLQCAKNGDFEKNSKGTGSAIAYAWYVWEKGYCGDPIIKWIN